MQIVKDRLQVVPASHVILEIYLAEKTHAEINRFSVTKSSNNKAMGTKRVFS